MNVSKLALSLAVGLTLVLHTAYGENGDGVRKMKISSQRSDIGSIEENEKLHLIFMREEEKLARDVYIKLSMAYPSTKVFGKISVSETQHTCAVCDALQRFGIEDPVVNDNVGVFSSEEFGDYFTEKYHYLTNKGEASELDALYVGAYIEEMDMNDIRHCPEVIIKRFDSADSAYDCGSLYSNNRVLNALYEHLISGSERHLRAFVKNIENQIGKGAYQAQVIDQEKVNNILKR
ncbi:DUF2202 domain-containing protein [Vibrio sp. SCSIO 43140]|uniref:DUF2202 domain-containing protein n=1 Tax=Vibrio sp. SCSIO 43140 TaxID=2819100 RepID=UPI002075EB48|nr:DUF2202 domain-containing protein [Vibrio sp. SCSIO 43140]USD63662.1 DUF2202 domain-containing protein [Vibrio sp. SCSIO 43140]